MRTASTKYGAADAPKTSIPRTIAVIGVLIAAAKHIQIRLPQKCGIKSADASEPTAE